MKYWINFIGLVGLFVMAQGCATTQQTVVSIQEAG
jgi:hypothetical protein